MSTPGQTIDTGVIDAAGNALAGDGDAVAACGTDAAAAATAAAGGCDGGPLAGALAELARQLEGRGRHLASALEGAGASLRTTARDADALDLAGARAIGGLSPEERA